MFYQEDFFMEELINIIIYCNNLIRKQYIITEKSEELKSIVNSYVNNKLLELNSKINKKIIIISKYNRYISFKKRKSEDYLWFIEYFNLEKTKLVDKTKSSINIGLVCDKIPIVGIIGLPLDNLIYYGCKNYGSIQINTNTLHKTHIKVTEFEIFDKNLRILIPKSSFDIFKNNNFTKFLNNPIIEIVDNNLDILDIVNSKADIFLRKNRTHECSTCAIQAILKYAGGTICDYDYGGELEYNNKYLIHNNYMCYGKLLESNI